MKKNGFTLVEMLAVIAVLGLLVSIIVPVVTNLLGDSEDALYEEQVNNVIVAAKQYMVLHSDLLPEQGSIASVTISELIDDGVIDNDKVIDPKTKDELSGCVVVNYNNDFNQYEYNYKNNCSITVTFDADGGSVSKSSMNVLYGKKYGDLPVPTRDGYTFMGWNGKNMFNIDVSPSTPSSTANSNTTQRVFTENSYVIGLAYNNYFRSSWVSSLNIASNTLNFVTKSGYGVAFPFFGESSKSYVLSYDAVLNFGNSSSIPISSILFYESDGSLISFNRLDGAGHKENICVAPDDTYYLLVSFSGNGSNTDLSFSKIQLEEGNTATEWEPYYVTSDVKVTQKSNHTLKAIWKANS